MTLLLQTKIVHLIIQGGGVVAYLDHSTNTINGGLAVQGDGSGYASADLRNSTNTVTGGIIIEDGCAASLSNSTNSITGGVTLSGLTDFSAVGLSNSTNIIDTVTVNDNASIIFCNTGSGTLTNTVTSITQAGNSSSVYLSNSGGGFAPTSMGRARNMAHMKKALRENSKNPFEAAVMGLSALDGPVVKSSGGYRVFLAPYAARIRSSGIADSSGFTEKAYGVVLGGSHYFKSIDTNLMLLGGIGASKTQQDAAAASKAKGKSLILGAVATKEIWDKKIDIISSLYGIITQNRQARQGNPIPTQSYVALSRYNTKTLSWQNEAGYVVKFQDGYSIRPKIGGQLLVSYRSPFSEQNAGTFAQKYRSRRQYSGW